MVVIEEAREELQRELERGVTLGETRENKWKLQDVDAKVVQERFILWLSKTQDLFSAVTMLLVKFGHSGKPDPGNSFAAPELEEIFMAEQTIYSGAPKGALSLVGIVSIEQFSRINALTGSKMQKNFKAIVAAPVCNDARKLVEYSSFRFLSRDGSLIHPCLKEPAFQQLIFITMLVWENPYRKEDGSEKPSLEGKLVGEEAFVCIAPAISGVADHSIAHNPFRALTEEEQGLSLGLWLTYIDELLKVREGRSSYQTREYPTILEEQILCIGSSRKRLVLKWEKIVKEEIQNKVSKQLEKKGYFSAEKVLHEKRDLAQLVATYKGKSTVEEVSVEPKALKAVELFAKEKEELVGHAVLNRRISSLLMANFWHL